jgi:hypothetical protein
MILTTSRSKVAREFGGEGCILFGGKLIFFDSLKQAIAAFEQLQIEHPVTPLDVSQLKEREPDPGLPDQ